MCLTNTDEPHGSWRHWRELFPSGVPDIYTNGDEWIPTWLLKNKKGIERQSMLSEILKGARLALLEDLYHRPPDFRWLNAKNSEGRLLNTEKAGVENTRQN